MSYSHLQTEQFSTVFEYCSEAVIIFEEDGTITGFNRAAQLETGYGEELAGKDITVIYPSLKKEVTGFVSFRGFQDDKTEDFVAYRKNQTCFPVKLKMIQMQCGEKRFGISMAINDQERSEAVANHRNVLEQLSEGTKLKNEFLSNITHELRTPINGMKGMAESLNDTELSQSQAETVSIITRCCDNMTKIINDLLDFSKLEAGKLSVEYREFNFKKFLDESLAFNVGRINEKGLKLIVDVGEDIPNVIVGDELRLGQVLNNLFSNAIKFTNEGHIGLEVAMTQHYATSVELMFMIIDTGIGISNEDKDKLFQSFSQVDGSITRRFGGTGLGLAICKQLVSLMGGTIRVDSEIGKGSTFSFTIKVGIGREAENGMSRKFPKGKFVYDRQTGKKPKASAEGSDENENAETAVKNDYSDNSKQEESYRFVPLDLFELENSFEMLKPELLEDLEKLDICMELGAWEKAEEFVNGIRNRIPQEEADAKRLSFRLLLLVRKEDHENASRILSELEDMLRGGREEEGAPWA